MPPRTQARAMGLRCTLVLPGPGPVSLHVPVSGRTASGRLHRRPGAPASPLHVGPLYLGPGADRRHLTATPTSHQGPSTDSRHQDGCPSLWRPNSLGTSRDTTL
ncbi:hypothetical protein NDU88_005507 [Pleurodeles waltl]|uniref:Uncharacterized protein n=1 Tax=Pleurodeles waltl TaxID=8319 RepID=A0AAV7SM37_PLEWA|nr:hypothetical protein NDU88_005507 [Pleurodeles waltl]